MANPVPMSKVVVVGPKAVLAPTVDALHASNLMHIEDYTPGDAGFDLGSPLPEGAQVSERLLKVRGLLKGAQITAPEAMQPTAQSLSALESGLTAIEAELAKLIDERNTATEQAAALEEEAATLRRIQNFPLPLELTHGYRSLTVATGFLPAEKDPSPLKTVHRDLEYVASEETEGTFLFVAAPKTSERALQDALSKLDFRPLEVAATTGTAAGRLAKIEGEITQLKEKATAAEARIADVGGRHAHALYALDELLTIEADKSTAPVRFRTTKNAFVIEGWVPTAKVEPLRTRLQGATGGRVVVETLHEPTAVHDAHHAEPHGEGHAPAAEPPVQLQQRGIAGNYVLLVDTYSRPKYNEFDPTKLFLWGFPFFYGMMLGDVGYGIVLALLLAFGAFNPLLKMLGFESRAIISRILLHCALASTAFGFLYGEMFGLELIGPATRLNHHTGAMEETHALFTWSTHFLGTEFPISRFHNVPKLLMISLIIAGIHLLVGLILGLRNGTKAHGFGAAFKHRGGWFLITLSAFLALAYLPGVIKLHEWEVHLPSYYLWFILALVGAGIITLLIGEGGMAMLELPSVLSNMLSYTRLVAIGLSGVGVAVAGNEVAKLVMAGGSIGGIIAGVLILAVFHGLNLGLGVIGPALHSLRLHYVEFFTKFYEGGGEPYAPFGMTRRYTSREVKQ